VIIDISNVKQKADCGGCLLSFVIRHFHACICAPKKKILALAIRKDQILYARSSLSMSIFSLFTRYCFTSKLYCGSLSSFYAPPPVQSLQPTLLQY